MKCAYCQGEITSIGHTCNAYTQGAYHQGGQNPIYYQGQNPEYRQLVHSQNTFSEKDLLNQIIQTLLRLEQKIDALEKK